MYYHVKVQTRDGQTLYEIDHTGLTFIKNNIIEPFLKKESIWAQESEIPYENIRRFLITKTDMLSARLVSENYKATYLYPSLKKSREYLVTEGKHAVDITDNLLETIRLTPDVQKNEDSVIEMPVSTQPTLFLAYSYSKEDEELVSGMKTFLQRKYEVLDGKASKLGSVSGTVLDKIRRSDLAVFVMTQRERKESGTYTTSGWLIEEKGAAIALGKKVAILVESDVDRNDIGGLHGDSQWLSFTRNNFMKVVMDLEVILTNSVS
ncbi:hypothetical protein JJB07_04320 [Tumebacillus sp. ITR2]|uniref:TIR domain-containing protein n=1 Tax=Tumebacillus amylolyticus TaxID=2801339 RepID=A0ABS1J6G2_9BACL|nr:hypothetical protein [Tumebacillus amylolyticus]MBL0385868.1 hypothetical protein [Tumebacillus amylolyticus]